MSEREAVRCCGRVMTVIAVDRPAHELSLHSCPSCGRHAWRQRGREVDRSELLEVLRPVREPAVARAAPVLSVADGAASGGTAGADGAGTDRSGSGTDEPDRRTELQRLLSGFTVHGTTS